MYNTAAGSALRAAWKAIVTKDCPESIVNHRAAVWRELIAHLAEDTGGDTAGKRSISLKISLKRGSVSAKRTNQSRRRQGSDVLDDVPLHPIPVRVSKMVSLTVIQK
jgi:hypothetical protein